MRKWFSIQTKRWISLAGGFILLLALLLPASLIVLADAPAPTIQSDKADYAPGDLVKLTGQYWQGDDRVYLVIDDNAGDPWVHTRTVNVAGDGTIRDNFKLPDYFVDNYAVTATGLTTGRVATTNFTDASIGTYDQCANDLGTGYTTGDTGCRWINGNLNPSNSYYVEGDASVQRLWLTGFVPGSTHTVSFHVGTTKSGTHAYDFLTTWNWSENWITVADRCETITGCLTAGESTIDIPQDPNVPDAFEPSAPGDRMFVMRGGTLTNVSTPVIAHGTYTGDSDTQIDITFTVASSGSMCPTTGSDRGTCGVVLWFGAHVGISVQWEVYNGSIGAGGIAGSPYHVTLEAVDGASVGNRDNQMQTSATNGTIVIIKDAVPNDAQDFNFSLNNNSTISNNFLLDDDANAVLSNTRTSNVPPGTWTASELNIPAGWVLTSLVCTDPTNNTIVNLPAGQATINLASNETVTCTFTDTKAGTITVAKVTSPAGSTQNFEFNPSWSTTNFFLVDGGSHSSGPLVPGTYSVSEIVPSGWQLQNSTCSDGSSVANIGLSAGENITCTFTNLFVSNPLLNVTKTSTTTTVTAANQVVPYTFVVTNTGNLPLSGVTVSDPKCTSAITGPTGDTNGDHILQLTETWTYGCTHTVTQAEFDGSASLANTVTVDSIESPVDTASLSIPISRTPALSIVKTATPTTYSAVGNVINYSYLVTNSGNVTLTSPFTVTDDKSTNEVCPATASLAPGGSITCTASYVITQADLNAGSVTNIASAHGMFGATQVNSPMDTETVTAVQTLALTIVKTASPTTYTSAGDVIHYSYLVTNTGNVTLSGPFTITDDKSTDEACPATASLAPGASITCTASYTITVSDITAGSVTNTASAHGWFGATPVNSLTDTETVTSTAVQTPALTIAKTPSPTTYSAVGNIINYSYLVTNSGNVTLTGPFTVADNKTTVICPATASLAAGASITCTASYTITQLDMDLGEVSNVATAHAFFGTTPVNSGQAFANVTAVPAPELTLVKTASPATYGAVGQLISYSYLVTNTGNVTLSGPFTVTDDKAATNCPVTASLAAGASITCSATYVITQADLDAGSVTNTAFASGSFNGTPVNSVTDTERVTAAQNPALTIVKVATPKVFDAVGNIISYSYTVTNSGNVTLSGPFTVADDKATDESCPATASLAPGSSITCNASYTITPADFGAGSVTNIATAGGWFNGTPVISPPDSETVTINVIADVAIVKQVSTATAVPGQSLTYTLVVTNDGPSPAYAVTVTDNLPAGLTFVPPATPPQNSGPNPLVWDLGTLASGESRVVTVQATVTANSGSIVNTATVTTNSVDPNPGNNSSTTTTEVLTPGLSVQKSVSVGEVVRNMPFSYTIHIINTGQVPLVQLTVTDTLPPGFHFVTGSATPQQPDSVVEPILTWNNLGPLPVGGAMDVTLQVTATPGTLGTFTNTVDVLGSYNCFGAVVTCGSVNGTATASIAVSDPQVEIVKSLVSADLDNIAPNYITFTIDVSNMGVSVIDILPLVDVFESSALRFVSASTPPNSSTDVAGVGTLTWTDLTGPTNGFNTDLALGQHFTITTVFEVIADITTTTNTATVRNSIDVLKNPAAEVTDAVTVSNIPTAVTNKYFLATSKGDRLIQLEWATVAEVNTKAFKVYRAPVNDFSQAASVGYITAKGNGSDYALIDQVPSHGRWYYWLVAVDMNENEILITHAEVTDFFKVYVPVVRR